MQSVSSPKTPGRDERGASLVEVLIVVALLGILSNLAIHSALEYKRRAEAAGVVADFRFFRDAVYQHYTNTGKWPRERGRHREPPELEEILEGKLRWVHPELGIEYDWDNWVRRNGTFKRPQTGVAYGFSVVIPRNRKRFDHVFDDIQKIYDGPLVRVGRKRLTFVIDPISTPEE